MNQEEVDLPQTLNQLKEEENKVNNRLKATEIKMGLHTIMMLNTMIIITLKTVITFMTKNQSIVMMTNTTDIL